MSFLGIQLTQPESLLKKDDEKCLLLIYLRT